MASFNKFDSFIDAVSKKLINLSTDSFKVLLSDVVPVRTNVAKTDITEIASGNGYSAGGAATTGTLTNGSGTEKLVLTNVTFTASGGAIAQFRYIVLYDTTATGHELMGWYDFGPEVNLASGATFTVTFDATNGALTIA